MRTIDIKQVDAFTRRALEGNPAGVVSHAEGLSDQEMQAVAKEMNCSETAFVLPSRRADLRLRYFTPAQEVDLCGHATIAALHALREEGRVTGPLQVETKVGILLLEAGDDMHWMRQDTPRLRSCNDAPETIARLLGLDSEDIDPEIPIGLAYTGLWDLVVPLRNREALRRAAAGHAGTCGAQQEPRHRLDAPFLPADGAPRQHFAHKGLLAGGRCPGRSAHRHRERCPRRLPRQPRGAPARPAHLRAGLDRGQAGPHPCRRGRGRHVGTSGRGGRHELTLPLDTTGFST